MVLFPVPVSVHMSMKEKGLPFAQIHVNLSCHLLPFEEWGRALCEIKSLCVFYLYFLGFLSMLDILGKKCLSAVCILLLRALYSMSFKKNWDICFLNEFLEGCCFYILDNNPLSNIQLAKILTL